MRAGRTDADLEDIENADCHAADFAKDSDVMSANRNGWVAADCLRWHWCRSAGDERNGDEFFVTP